jgi:hypothetical protein
MIPRRNKTGKRSRETAINIKNFKGGSNLLLDEARLGVNEAKQILNLIQVQDGLWKPRWGRAYYGEDIGATIDGASEYVKGDETTETVAISNGKAYKSTDGGAWTEISGATFTAGVKCYFMQIAQYLYIANGTDALARYNGTVLSTYSSISAPANLNASLPASGLSSGSYVYYAEVTALNEVGETTGSTEASITVNKERDTWVAGTDKITWYWNSVVGASRYQLYIGDESGDEFLLASTTVTNFVDDGSIALNPYVVPPLQNTTSAPKFKSMAISGNRIWGTNDPNNKYMVHFSGTGSFIGNFSDFYGGGWINLEKGGRELPSAIVHYQTGTGSGTATVLSRTPEGRGAVWQISIGSATVGDTTFSIPTAQKIIGSFGTESILGVAQTDNDVLFPNRRGMYSLGPEKNYYGILRTRELTARIRPYWRSLIGDKLSGIASYFYDSKVFISVPTTSDGNSRIVIYDTERTNWTVDWDFGAKQFLEYTDTGGDTHLLYVPYTGNKLVEISENISGDFGSAFSTLYSSGRIELNPLWKDFTKVKNVYIKLGNPRGTINFEVSGTSKNNPFQSLGTATISSTISNTGMGFDLMGDVKMGSTNGSPSTFSDSSDPHYIKIRKKLRDIQFRVTTSEYDADYILQGFIIEGNQLKTNAPSSWRL